MFLQNPIWIEKIEGRGEDAQPFLIDAPDGASIVGVFDGLGGAGSNKVKLRDDITKSEAAIAASHVGEVARKFFQNNFSNYSVEEIRDELHLEISSSLSELDKSIPRIESKIKSSMAKKLPTTLAIARYIPDEKNSFLQIFWSGDSRIYGISQEGHLECLTKDHCNHRSSLTELEYYAWNGDAAMTNCVTTSKEFFIDCIEINNPNNLCIFACSDGLPTSFPDHLAFENHILSVFIDEENEENFIEVIKSGRTDDVSASFINFETQDSHINLISKRISEIEALTTHLKGDRSFIYDVMKTFHRALDTKPKSNLAIKDNFSKITTSKKSYNNMNADSKKKSSLMKVLLGATIGFGLANAIILGLINFLPRTDTSVQMAVAIISAQAAEELATLQEAAKTANASLETAEAEAETAQQAANQAAEELATLQEAAKTANTSLETAEAEAETAQQAANQELTMTKKALKIVKTIAVK